MANDVDSGSIAESEEIVAILHHYYKEELFTAGYIFVVSDSISDWLVYVISSIRYLL